MAGKTHLHPTTGDELVVLIDTAESQGACFRFEYRARTATPPPPDHVHADQEERVEVLEGTLHCRVDGDVRVLEAGESLTIPRGALHTLWHGGDGPSRSIGEFRPAGYAQAMFETVFGVAS